MTWDTLAGNAMVKKCCPFAHWCYEWHCLSRLHGLEKANVELKFTEERGLKLLTNKESKEMLFFTDSLLACSKDFLVLCLSFFFPVLLILCITSYVISLHLLTTKLFVKSSKSRNSSDQNVHDSFVIYPSILPYGERKGELKIICHPGWWPNSEWEQF